MEYENEALYVTLPEMLEFREEKAFLQNQLLREAAGKKERGGTEQRDENQAAVISLGMNIPGPVKSGPSVYGAFLEGCRCVETAVAEAGGKVEQAEVLEKKSGYAAVYLVAGVDRTDLKKSAVKLEETHPLGRLFDIDVFDEEGSPMIRELVGAGRRKCLLCGKDAKECGRSRTHSVEELQKKVFEIIGSWKAGGAG